MSHFDYAVRYDLRAARRFVEPLEHGEPVPGCGCPDCTGVPEDSPARQPLKVRDFSHWEARAERARSMGILEVARRLGLDCAKTGGGVYARCPFHDDRKPSLHLAPEKGLSGLWYCPVCTVGGDPVELFMRARRMDFADAVRDLVPNE